MHVVDQAPVAVFNYLTLLLKVPKVKAEYLVVVVFGQSFPARTHLTTIVLSSTVRIKTCISCPTPSGFEEHLLLQYIPPPVNTLGLPEALEPHANALTG